jgi:hypothetical protein
LSPEQLRELVGPIALYPDPLLAQVLAAATYPLEVVQAARFVREHEGDEAINEKIDAQPWDASVLALARYPSVLFMLDENLEWTQSLGAAFIYQQQDVMDAVQWSRFQAQQAGNLATTKEQAVVVRDRIITIEPAQPDVIYVPYYEPEVVYVEHVHYHRPLITFGIHYSVGSWLHLDCDWHHRRVSYGGRYHNHHSHSSHAHAHVHVDADRHGHADRHAHAGGHGRDRDHAHGRGHGTIGSPWRHDNTKPSPRLRRDATLVRTDGWPRPIDGAQRPDAVRPYFRAAPRYDRSSADADRPRIIRPSSSDGRSRSEPDRRVVGPLPRPSVGSAADRPRISSTPLSSDRSRQPERPVAGPLQRRSPDPSPTTPRATRSTGEPAPRVVPPRAVEGPAPPARSATRAAEPLPRVPSIGPAGRDTSDDRPTVRRAPVERPAPRPSPAPRATPLPSPSPTPTPRATPAPTPRPTPTPRATPLPTPRPSPAPRVAPLPTPRPSLTPRATPSPTPRPSPAPRATPAPTPRPSLTPRATPQNSGSRLGPAPRPSVQTAPSRQTLFSRPTSPARSSAAPSSSVRIAPSRPTSIRSNSSPARPQPTARTSRESTARPTPQPSPRPTARPQQRSQPAPARQPSRSSNSRQSGSRESGRRR